MSKKKLIEILHILVKIMNITEEISKIQVEISKKLDEIPIISVKFTNISGQKSHKLSSKSQSHRSKSHIF